MTSNPASRSARAITFTPRSCPSRPGLATTTRYGRDNAGSLRSVTDGHPREVPVSRSDPRRATVVAAAGVLRWDAEAKQVVACEGVAHPVDGGSQQHYLVTIDNDGQLVVNVNPEALTSTTTSPTTTTIRQTGN